jgi:hypothetical protein
MVVDRPDNLSSDAETTEACEEFNEDKRCWLLLSLSLKMSLVKSLLSLCELSTARGRYPKLSSSTCASTILPRTVSNNPKPTNRPPIASETDMTSLYIAKDSSAVKQGCRVLNTVTTLGEVIYINTHR